MVSSVSTSIKTTLNFFVHTLKTHSYDLVHPLYDTIMADESLVLTSLSVTCVVYNKEGEVITELLAVCLCQPLLCHRGDHLTQSSRL